MLTRIFKKRGAADKAKGQEARPVAPSSVKKIIPSGEAASQFDITVDEGMAALHSLLSELPRIEVAQAAKERGWAKMQRELEKHPVRPAASAAPKGVAAKPVLGGNQARTLSTGHSRGWRVAIGSMAAVVAIMIGVLSSYGAGLFNGTATVTTGNVADVTTASTQTPTSSPTSVTTRSTGGSTTETTPGTSSTDSNTTTVTTGTGTTGSTQGNTTTSGSVGPSNPTTTVTTDTDVTQLANSQHEKTALDVAFDLGDAVCAPTPNLTLARSFVASSAQSALTQMVMTLHAPSGYQKVALKTLPDGTVRITLEFTDVSDQTTDTNGQPLVIHPRFNLTVQVNANGATIVGISRGS